MASSRSPLVLLGCLVSLAALGCGDSSAARVSDTTGPRTPDPDTTSAEPPTTGTTAPATTSGTTDEPTTGPVVTPTTSGTTGTTDTSGAPAECGNGILEPGEACDDGNLVDGDGCESSCQPGDLLCG